MQQSAMFASLTSATSLTICSHEAQAFRGPGVVSKGRPQYTQLRSRAITNSASSRGIFQRAAVWMRASLITANFESVGIPSPPWVWSILQVIPGSSSDIPRFGGLLEGSDGRDGWPKNSRLATEPFHALAKPRISAAPCRRVCRRALARPVARAGRRHFCDADTLGCCDTVQGSRLHGVDQQLDPAAADLRRRGLSLQVAGLRHGVAGLGDARADDHEGEVGQLHLR